MRTIFVFAVILNGAVALAQSFQSQQRTTGVVGIAPGQTARLNVLYPTTPAPIIPVQCSAALAIADDNGGVIKSSQVAQILAGRSIYIDLNADTDLPPKPRTQVHGFTIAPNGCRLIATLEVIDNATHKTVTVVTSEVTSPFPAPVAMATLQPAAQ